jgi:hypothetical protein
VKPRGYETESRKQRHNDEDMPLPHGRLQAQLPLSQMPPGGNAERPYLRPLHHQRHQTLTSRRSGRGWHTHTGNLDFLAAKAFRQITGTKKIGDKRWQSAR